ncbi:FabD/lysophospholipase-like protein [Xylariaceae sp. AK1471]|nr:FabD/lysophospholipase-like protein [Xylariaceae sp. AK1471]
MAGTSTATPNVHFAETSDQGVSNAPGPWFQKTALSFDGGGVRGYWSLLVLQHLMGVIQKVEIAENEATRSSFHPFEVPDNVSHLVNPNNLVNPIEYTPFLPCHYFDYIGGTSTGALIAILLSRFRMTVEDCLQEYETMAGAIFGRPRTLHKMNTIVVKRNKYSRKTPEKVTKEVIERRAELRDEDDPKPLFQTEIDTCRGVVLAMQLRGGQVVQKRFLFRSYTPYSEKSRKNAERSGNFDLKNRYEGIRISLLKVALAGTAAPFYFGHYHTVLFAAQVQASTRVPTRNGTNFFTRVEQHLPEGEYSYEFIDAGFSSANNPCNELYREIQHHHGENTPVLVSIGTARPVEELNGESTRATIKRAFSVLGNPEEVHEGMEADKDNGKYCYYRLNDEEGIDIEMDEWKPRKIGHDTMAKMTNEFHNWLQKDGVEDKFRECARHLVRLRRVRMTTPRWERFALGQYFVCQVQHCPKDRDNKWLDREDFENHLRREHKEEDYEGNLARALETCQRIWRYRARRQTTP